MSDNYRMERIKRLMSELEYELHRGFMEGEIDESIAWSHIFPVSRQINNGVIILELRTRPVHRDSLMGRDLNLEPRLKLVTDGEKS